MKYLDLEGEGVVLHLEYEAIELDAIVALSYCLARFLRYDFRQKWARKIATSIVRSIIAKLVKDDKNFLYIGKNYRIKEGRQYETD